METLKEMSLAELAQMVGGEVSGDPQVMIHDLKDLDSARPGEISFITSSGKVEKIAATRASAVIAPKDIGSADKALILVDDPNVAAAIIHTHFCTRPFVPQGVHSTAHVGSDCLISTLVTIGANAVLGNGVKLGERVSVGAGVVIGDDVVVGDDTVLHANVTVAHGCRIGSRVILHSGVVVGSDGFGYATDRQGNHIKRPQVGIVVIEDDVEIGANTTVDRATFGQTIIGRGVKIDNLVQVAHNVEIGQGSILVSQSGIAGSTTLGKWVVVAGQAAITGHIQLGDGVKVAGKSGVLESCEPGAVVAGMPAIAHQRWLRASLIFAKLPDIAKEIRGLKKKIAELADKL